jgi:hypothetical protein
MISTVTAITTEIVMTQQSPNDKKISPQAFAGSLPRLVRPARIQREENIKQPDQERKTSIATLLD